jgi:hypothetical protein
MAPPAAPTFVVSGFGATAITGASLTLNAATAYALTVTETAVGGGPVTPGTLTIALDNAAVGTVSGATLTTGLGNATGHVTITDTKTGLSATLKVSVLSTLPATVGDTLTLAGTLTHVVTRPLPAPSAIAPPQTTVVNVTDVLTIPSVTAAFGPKTGLIDENLVESDAAPLQTITTTSDTFAGFSPSSAGQTFAEAGVTSTDSNGVTDSTTFGTGNGTIDQLPDVTGSTFSNTAALTFSETEPDTTTIGRTVNADGTYTETDDYYGFSVAAVTQTNPDLSATITGFADYALNVAYGAPTGTGTSASIPVTITPQAPSTSPPFVTSVPDWYPTTTIASDTFAKTASATIPAACKVPATVGTTATQVTELKSHLDTALGSYEKRTQTVYDAPGFGSVCIQLADEIDSYYDYTGQTAGILGNLALYSTPVQIDTIAETLGFTTGSVSGSSTARKSAQSVSSGTVLRAVTPVFDRAVAAVYRAKREAARQFALSHRAALAKEIGR